MAQKEFYVVIPEGFEGEHLTLEEAQNTALNYLKRYNRRSYLLKAVSLCKKREVPVEWVDLDNE